MARINFGSGASRVYNAVKDTTYRSYDKIHKSQVDAIIKTDTNYKQKKELGSYAKAALSGSISMGNSMASSMNPDTITKRKVYSNCSAGLALALSVPATLQISRAANHSHQLNLINKRGATGDNGSAISSTPLFDPKAKLSTNDFNSVSVISGKSFHLKSRNLASEVERLQKATRNALLANKIDVSKLDNNQLINLINQNKGTNVGSLLGTELHLRNTANDIKGGRRKNIKGRIAAKRLFNTNFMTIPGMNGLASLRSDTRNIRMIAKVIGTYYGGLSRLAIHGASKGVSKATRFAASKITNQTASKVLTGVSKGSGAVAKVSEKKFVSKKVASIKGGMKEKVLNSKAARRNKMAKMKNDAKKSAARAFNKAFQNHPYVLKGARAFKKFGGGITSKVKGVFNAFNGGLDFVSLLTSKIKSVILTAVFGAGGLILFACGFVVLSLVLAASVMTITDAVDKKKEESTLGVTYEALLDLDKDFSQQVLDISKNAKIPDKDIYKQNFITQYTDQSVYYMDGDGEGAYSSQTIKGILSMASIYIDQDFSTYGLGLVGAVLETGTCTFKQYALDLYKASHMVGVFPTEIYYDADSQGTQKVAEAACNNKIPAGASEGGETGLGRPNSASFTKEDAIHYRNYTVHTGSGENASSEDRTETKHYDKYTLIEDGPHGSISYSTGGEDNDYGDAEAKADMEAKGCKSYTIKVTNKSDYGHGDPCIVDKVIVCTDAECRGHIDSNVMIFISNIYDPSLSVGIDGSENKDPYETADGESREFKYSLYSLDRYATFDRGNMKMDTATGVLMPDPTDEEKALPDTFEAQTIMLKNIVAAAGTQITSGDVSELKAIDWTNRTLEDGIHPIDSISNFLGGLNLTTQTAYYSQIDENNSGIKIDEIDSKGKNPVTDENSSKYSFQTYTFGGYKINEDFSGWNKDNIERTRLLMAGDWNEFYGITDFGGITGAPMTEEQIKALLANNPEFKDLSPDRQSVMYATQVMLSKCAGLNVHYHGHACTAGSIEELNQATNKRQVFSGGSLNNICTSAMAARYGCLSDVGVDCSGFVSWIYYVSVGFPSSKITTGDLMSGAGGALREISPTELLPGDICVKRTAKSGHTRMYLGGGKWAEAASHAGGIRTKIYSFTEMASEGYRYFRNVNIDDTVVPDNTDNIDTNNNTNTAE